MNDYPTSPTPWLRTRDQFDQLAAECGSRVILTHPAVDKTWTSAPLGDRPRLFRPARDAFRGDMLGRLVDLNQQRDDQDVNFHRPHLPTPCARRTPATGTPISTLFDLCDGTGIDDDTDLHALLDRATSDGALETKVYRGTDQWRPS